MTPKEKATEVYDKFYKEVPTRVMHFELHCALAKRAALILVDEIIELDVWSSGHSAEEGLAFWNKVRKELEKL